VLDLEISTEKFLLERVLFVNESERGDDSPECSKQLNCESKEVDERKVPKVTRHLS
jgi:hypothetical protein